MTTFDFSPLFRSTVGFDRLSRMLETGMLNDQESAYPPYNIEKTADAAYRISIAVAGFSPDDLSVEVKEGAVHVTARKAPEDAKTYLHRGIATRAFDRRFALADHVRVTGAHHEHGMLHIDLLRETPEALKPRRIAINSTTDAKQLADQAN